MELVPLMSIFSIIFEVNQAILTPVPLKTCTRLQHLTPLVCINVECLKTMFVMPSQRPVSIRYPALNDTQIKKLRMIPGFVDDNCLWLISRLADMQWINGVYGSIGLLGINQLKIIGILAMNINEEIGEKMLINLEKRNENVKSTLKNLGFSNYKFQENSILNDSVPTDFKNFRFISINGWSDLNLLVRRLDHSACILRNGGIISVDEVDLPDSTSLRAVEFFLSKHGYAVFTPFIHTRNRLFLTTTNYFNIYYHFFIENRHLLLAYGLREASSTRFGARYSYFIAAD